jgi:hypothetical protein
MAKVTGTDVLKANEAWKKATEDYLAQRAIFDNTKPDAKNFAAVAAATKKTKAAVDAADAKRKAIKAQADEQSKTEGAAKKAKADVESSANRVSSAQSEIATIEKQIAKAQAGGLDVSSLQSQLATAKEKLVPKAATVDTSGTGNTGGTGGTGATGPSETYSQLISRLSDPAKADQLKGFQQELNKLGPNFAVNANGLWSVDFQNKLQKLFQARAILPTGYQGADINEFITIAQSNPQLIGSAGAGAGVAGPKATSQYNLTDPTSASYYINNAISTVLKREATPQEVADLTKILNDAEKKNPTKRDVNGNVTGGLGSPGQFIVDLIKTGKYADKTLGKLKTLANLATEVKSKQADVLHTTAESLASVARANGLDIGQAQLDAWANDVKNGKDIKVIENNIRATAGLGMPDHVKKLLADGTDLNTIYAPYQSVMAKTLEIDPNSIQLSDPTLRNAIGPDKEMPLYEFQRALKKDSRWQYTNNARDEVSSSVNQVLKDFGFVG